MVVKKTYKHNVYVWRTVIIDYCVVRYEIYDYNTIQHYHWPEIEKKPMCYIIELVSRYKIMSFTYAQWQYNGHFLSFGFRRWIRLVIT